MACAGAGKQPGIGPIGMQGKPGKGKQPMPGGKGIGCMALIGLHGALLLPPLTVVWQEPLGLEARSNCRRDDRGRCASQRE